MATLGYSTLSSEGFGWGQIDHKLPGRGWWICVPKVWQTWGSKRTDIQGDFPREIVNNLCLPRPANSLLLHFLISSMDTISRENNSMLPVGGIVVGVIGLLLGGIALLQISKVNKTLAEHQAKVDLVDSVKGQAETAAAVAEKTAKELSGLTRSTQDAFNQVGGELGNLRGAITKFEEAAKKPVPVVADKKGGKSGPAVAGPGEYVVKAGDGGTKIAKANGVSLADLQAVNPGVDWTKLKVGQKVKLPKK
jgi:LysM repeat protein